MVYLTDAKKDVIVKKWHGALPTSSISMLIDEVAAAILADAGAAPEAAHVANAAAVTAADTALTAVSGVDGAGNNAASKADVDARLTTQEAFNDQAIADLTELQTQLNAVIGSLETAGLMATS